MINALLRPHQVSPLPAHAGAAAVRALPQGAGERPVRQVHRRAAAAALAALLQEAHAAAAGAGRAAAPAAATATAAAAAGPAARQRRHQVTLAGGHLGSILLRNASRFTIAM